MSKSYDRASQGLRPRPGPPPVDAYDDPSTGPPDRRTDAYDALGVETLASATEPATYPEPRVRQIRRDQPPPSRSSNRDYAQTPIVPAGSVTSRSLTLVISIMCCLACLTAGAVYLIDQSARAWRKDIAGEVTVQVAPRENVDIEQTLQKVATFLQGQPGIVSVRPFPVEATRKLLEPWLGQADILKTLPVPRIIALEIDRSKSPDVAVLRATVERDFPGVTLDDHRRWQRQIRTVTRSFALGGFAILALMAAATVAVIVSATRSAMLSNREIVEVLHFVGATDRLIAREFEKHFLRLGVRAGIVGAGVAMLFFLLMPLVMSLLAGGGDMSADMKRLIGSGVLDLSGYVLLGIVVVVISALCMLTSRRSVFGILNSRQ